MEQETLSTLASRAASTPFGGLVSKNIEVVRNSLFPTESHELWRYTHPDLFPFKELSSSGESEISLVDAATGKPVEIQGLSIRKVTTTNIPGFSLLQPQQDPVWALQMAAAREIWCVTVAPKTKVGMPLSIRITPKADRITSPVVLIGVGAHAEVTFIDQPTIAGFVHTQTELIIAERARCQFVSLLRLDDSARYLARHIIHLAEGAFCSSFHLAVGSGISRVDIECYLDGSDARAELNGCAKVTGSGHVDFHTSQIHMAPRCTSDLLFKNLIKDFGRSVYYGYIRVAEDAQKTDAYQQSRNLLLSERGRADAIPNLEIKANDVKCSHGASITQFTAEEMFYLQSRGLSKEKAEELLVTAFLEEAIARCTDTWVAEQVRGLLF